MPSQLTFDLPVKTALGRDDFFVSPSNVVAVAALEDWRGWPLGRMVLCGPGGSGKTHLAHVWAQMADARIVESDQLTARGIDDTFGQTNLVIENAQKLAGDLADEEALFHLYNYMQTGSASLLLTAEQPPSRWGIQLPDLLSRLQSIGIVTLQSPDDALLSALLIKLFNDRQIAVSPGVVPYCVGRMERSFDGVHRLVAALDGQALEVKKAIGVRLAGQVLDKMLRDSA